MTETISQERQDLLETLATHRYFLRQTTDGLTDEQLRSRPTVSELNLGGLIKHVAATEDGWLDFIERGPDTMPKFDPEAPLDEELVAQHRAGFELSDDETLADVLAEYDRVAARSDELVRTADLDRSWPLPPAPWFEPGASRSIRRCFTHIVAETAQHAGHADILREAIDGKKTMG